MQNKNPVFNLENYPYILLSSKEQGTNKLI